MPVATSHSVAGKRRLGRTPSVPEATATATTTVVGGPAGGRRAVWFFVPSARPTLPPAVPLHYWRGVGRGK